MIVSLSTGSVRHGAEGRLQQVHLVEKEFGRLIDGVELCILSLKELEGFELDKRAAWFMKGLCFNSLHAPCKGIEYGKNRQTRKVFEKAREIDKAVGLQHVVFHPNHVKDFKVLKGLGIRALIENLPDGKTKKGWQFPKEMQKFFEKWPRFGFCFDVNHAMANGVNPKEFISVLGEKIDCIHLNATEKKGKAEHNMVVESSKGVQKKIRPVFRLGKPIVIEADNEKEKIPLIREEIALAREMGKNSLSLE